jgi:Iron-containing redox enzyme
MSFRAMTLAVRPRLPQPRGPISEVVIDALRRAPGPIPAPNLDGVDMLDDDDAQLALTVCYELHYESFLDVDDRWEWAPELLALTNQLELAFELRLIDAVGAQPDIAAPDVVPALLELVQADGPSLSSFLEARGSREHMREFCVHRSEYQRKEADPHTWMIPRLRGRAKAAAVTIQYDEYGEGVADAMHAELFATTMEALDLESGYGVYRDLLPAATLATGNLVTMFGLHRRWRAACVGHLAVFEMTSVVPMTRYASALRRLGVSEDARRFYDVHVEADAWHEQVAQHELVSGLIDAEPDAGGGVIFGARALMEVERRMTTTMLDAWSRHTTSLLQPLPRQLAAS